METSTIDRVRGEITAGIEMVSQIRQAAMESNGLNQQEVTLMYMVLESVINKLGVRHNAVSVESAVGTSYPKLLCDSIITSLESTLEKTHL